MSFYNSLHKLVGQNNPFIPSRVWFVLECIRFKIRVLGIYQILLVEVPTIPVLYGKKSYYRNCKLVGGFLANDKYVN